MIFSINTTDLSAQVNNKKSYKMNSTRQFSSVTDSNGIEYRNYYRERVSGSFEMWFIDPITPPNGNESTSAVDYSTFLTLVQNNTTNGVLLCTVYVQNKGVTQTINCFCDITMKKEADVNGFKVRIINLKILEC